MGGANALAGLIAERLRAQAVLTTATDVNGIFSVDEFAAENDLIINNRDGIKKINKKLLQGMTVNMAIDDDVIISSDASDADRCALQLIFKPIVIGIGFKKEKSGEELLEFIKESLDELSVKKENIAALASIDIKRDTAAIRYLGDQLKVPCYFYTAEELESLEGDFDSSDLVREKVGVSDVSERAAAMCGKAGSFVLKKKKKDGMTISVFEKYRRISFAYGKG